MTEGENVRGARCEVRGHSPTGGSSSILADTFCAALPVGEANWLAPRRGSMAIARHLSAGERRCFHLSPGGTTELFGDPAVPPGLRHYSASFPALKCRAISTASLRDAKTHPISMRFPRTRNRANPTRLSGELGRSWKQVSSNPASRTSHCWIPND